MWTRFHVVLMITALSMTSCTLLGGSELDSATVSGNPSPEVVALEAAQAHLGRYLGRELASMEVAYGPAQWTDTSLGCPQAGFVYDERLVAGYEFELTVDGAVHELHASDDGTIVVWCGVRLPGGGQKAAAATPAEIDRPLRTAQSLLASILGVSIEAMELDSVAWRALTFPDTGLGCAEPGTPVLEVLTEGYSFLFTYQGNTYKIHTDLTGDMGVLCGESGPALGAEAAPVAEAGDDLSSIVPPAVAKARQLLAAETGVDPESLAVTDLIWREATFSSSALGCPEPGVEYVDEETRGYIFTVFGADVEIHTDLLGERGMVCTGSEPVQALEAAAASSSRSVFTSYANELLGFGVSYPIEWRIGLGDSEREIVFSPADATDALGMSVALVEGGPEAPADLLIEYQAALLATDPTAAEWGEPEASSSHGWSQLFARQIDGAAVLERTSFPGNGYLVRQWAPQSQWSAWKDLFVQMLNSLIVLQDSGG